MTKQDASRFARAFGLLAEVFGEPISSTRTKAYFLALGNLDIIQVERAIEVALRQCKFFPRPAELRELIEGTPEDQALRAWEVVTEAHKRAGIWMSVVFEDATIAPALKRVFGGWSGLCECVHTATDEMIASRRKEFLVAYRNALRFGESQHYLMGYCERENLETSGGWKFGPTSSEFEQTVYLALSNGGRKVTARYDSATGELLSSVDELFSAPPMRLRLAASTAPVTNGSSSEGEPMPHELREAIEGFLMTSQNVLAK